VPGTTDIGNHCDDCTTPITFPFPVSLYGTTFTSANVSSNGNLQFTGNTNYLGRVCPLPDPNLGEAILPYQDDLRTDEFGTPCGGAGCGVFTSVSGSAPNRIFNIEWHTGYFGRSGNANFEVRLYESGGCFDIIYGATVDNGGSEESGVQQSATGPGATTFSCNTPTLTNGLKVTYCCAGAPTPTPTPTGTPTCTPSGSKIYNIAGFGLGIQTTTTRIYDIATNSWTTGAPLPQALFLPGFGAINGKVYVASGNSGAVELNTLYIYDIATNMWTTGPVVPTAVTGPGSTVYQGKLYLFGGGFPSPLTITQIYDPVANSWSSGPNLNFARLWFYGGAIDNTSIVAPGGDNPPGIPLSVNEQLTATWAIKAPLPFPARGPFAVA